jgi:nicotinamidase-related amidase
MSQPRTSALIVIDVQNDYFPGGAYPLWDTDATLERIEAAIAIARRKAIPVIVVQHVADARKGRSPFFNADTAGVQVHARVLAAAPGAIHVQKSQADSFLGTTFEAELARHDVEQLIVCGMMTQNCVTHTAISRSAEKYQVSVLADCCTTVDQMIHKIALGALAARVPLIAAEEM